MSHTENEECPHCGAQEFEQEQSTSTWDGHEGVFWVCGNCNYTEFVDEEGNTYAPYEPNGVLQNIGRIVEWQKLCPSHCARCGQRMTSRPMNTAHADKRIELCDKCAALEAIVQSDALDGDTDKAREEFWDGKHWVALFLSEDDSKLLHGIDLALDLAKEAAQAGVDLDTPMGMLTTDEDDFSEDEDGD